MATFNEVLEEIQETQLRRQRDSIPDTIRRKHLRALHQLTGRNVIIYYSGWLHRRGPEHFFTTQINDEDKHGFMAVFAGLDFEKPLDLILHTPGGEVAATESIVEYIRSKFKDNVRVIVPQISMSGGTMIALAGNPIVMGRHSNLGPIDPQFGNRPALAILQEFETARADIQANPANAALWIPILQQYEPTLLSRAAQSIEWTREIAKKAVLEGFLRGTPDAAAKADEIVSFLLSSTLHKAHGRHLHRDELAAKGLPIQNLEEDPALQDAVLTVHHAAMLSMSNFGVAKIIENHNGTAHMKVTQQIALPVQMPVPQQPMPQPMPQQPQPVAPPQFLPFRTRLKLAWRLLRNQLG